VRTPGAQKFLIILADSGMGKVPSRIVCAEQALGSDRS
jgi:hypothetical protein